MKKTFDNDIIISKLADSKEAVNNLRVLCALNEDEDDYENQLYHHGILGMKWGIRRYQPYGHGGYNPNKKGVNKLEKAAKRKKELLKKTESNYDKIEKNILKRADSEYSRYEKIKKDNKGVLTKKANKHLDRWVSLNDLYEFLDEDKVNALDSISKMSLQDISNSKRVIARQKVKNVLSGVKDVNTAFKWYKYSRSL